VDISPSSVKEASRRISRAGLSNVTFSQGDIRVLRPEDGMYDHAVICFVLEHLLDPAGTLRHLKTLIRPGGTITVIEGDHGLVALSPECPAAMKAISCQIHLQAAHGGDACIGRRLYPLLASAGLDAVRVSPRMVYVDASRPELVDGFTRKTFTAMIKGVKDDALRAGLITPAEWEEGIAGLLRTCEPDGTFCYLFFKGCGVVSSSNGG
jgi:SAM-dependent methyltransferase